MNQTEMCDKFAELWRKSREDAGKSQEYMAKKLDVSKKTVQNWECGLSCPNQAKGFQWFSVLGLNPLPYYLGIIYKEFDGISPSTEDKQIENALIAYIHGMTNEERRKLLYFLYGNHGSSTSGVIEMLTAYLHTPLITRLNVCHSIITNYELAIANHIVVNPQHIQPNMPYLFESYKNAKEAVLQNKKEYSNLKEE